MSSKAVPSEEDSTSSSEIPGSVQKLPYTTVSLKNVPCTFTKTVRTKLLLFQRVVGMTENPTTNFMIWYRRGLIALLFLATLRRSTQITLLPAGSASVTAQERLLDPTVVLSLTRFVFLLAGFYTSVTLSRSYSARMTFLEQIDLALEGDDSLLPYSKAKKITAWLILTNILLSITAGIFDTALRMGMMTTGAPFLPPIFTNSWFFLPLECYLITVCQCCITLFATDFFMSCTYTRYVIANLCRKMKRDFKSSPTLVKLQHLDEIQTQHHHLVSAKRKLEDCYSLHIFCFYGMSIPAVCFLSYVAYRNAGTEPGIVVSVGVWILIVIWHLLILSLPAFQMTEEGEDISNCAFELYNSCLKGEEDSKVSSQMLMLISQIQSNKMAISAYNYFPMNRSILLTMFSAIFTYFLILVQFSEGDVSASSDLAKVAELCRNHTF